MATINTLSPLLTDLYQLTMGYGYWKSGMAEREAVFHLFFRRAPFGENAAIVAGIESALEWLETFQFSDDEITYLASLIGNDGKPMFEQGYLEHLKNIKLGCEVWAIPEGELVYANEPIMRVRGSLVQCQLLETALLNIINFQTLIATQAARICEAAEGDPVLEFGLRRAQGPDGGLSASRAAYIGGCVGTSNVLAGQQFDIPVKGTHAHSWVMSFDDELEAFETYAKAMPNNCVLLIDTYDTAQGIENAIKVGKAIRNSGGELAGVRLDSGDLVELSKLARRRLDEEGFPDANVVASNDLNVETIKQLKAKGAKIDVWGVGTKLVTAYEQAALGGVYKLAALRNEVDEWQWKVKRSNDIIKVSNPGILQVRRTDAQDVIEHNPNGEGLLKPIFKNGVRVMDDNIHAVRERAISNWSTRPGDHRVILDDTVMKMKQACLDK